MILNNDQRRFIDRSPDFLEYFSNMGIGVDIFPYTREEVNSMLADGNYLIKSALSEGINL